MSVFDKWKFVPVNKGIPNVNHKAVKSLQQIGQALFIKQVALLHFYGFPTYLPTCLLDLGCTKT